MEISQLHLFCYQISWLPCVVCLAFMFVIRRIPYEEDKKEDETKIFYVFRTSLVLAAYLMVVVIVQHAGRLEQSAYQGLASFILLIIISPLGIVGYSSTSTQDKGRSEQGCGRPQTIYFCHARGRSREEKMSLHDSPFAELWRFWNHQKQHAIRWQNMISLLITLRQEGLKPDAFTFTTMLGACISKENVQLADLGSTQSEENTKELQSAIWNLSRCLLHEHSASRHNFAIH